MEFIIRRDVFLDAIQKTLGIAEKKTTHPILNNILISTEDGRIKIIATDREIGLVARYECNVITGGSITLLARKLYELVRECQGDDVHVVIDEKNVATVSCRRAVFRMYGLPADDYPSIVDDSQHETNIISNDIVRALISRTYYAASNDETRRNLNGVFFKVEPEGGKNQAVMVSTDGHRLALMKKDVSLGDWSAWEKGVIIPKKGLMEIKKLLEGAVGDVQIGLDHGMITIKRDSTLLRVSLIAEKYPNYTRVIPTEWEGTVTFKREDVLHALRRMSVLASDEHNGVIIKLRPQVMILNSANQDLGEASEELDVTYEGEEMEVGFNVSFLMSALEVIDEEDVVFHVGGIKKASVIMAVGTDDYQGIVMPLRIEQHQ
ncbi:MAG: DNA polymerase III subunit beta [Smithellaceae bacterium]|nr:DNA polymerase III subunit beta [Smithellaceae bacterium]